VRGKVKIAVGDMPPVGAAGRASIGPQGGIPDFISTGVTEVNRDSRPPIHPVIVPVVRLPGATGQTWPRRCPESEAVVAGREEIGGLLTGIAALTHCLKAVGLVTDFQAVNMPDREPSGGCQPRRGGAVPW